MQDSKIACGTGSMFFNSYSTLSKELQEAMQKAVETGKPVWTASQEKSERNDAMVSWNDLQRSLRIADSCQQIISIEGKPTQCER